MDEITFHYTASCSFSACTETPRYKIAAPWSHGPLRELKNYGLACDRHREALLTRARKHREGLAVGDEEAVGPVAVFSLIPGHRDVELPCLPDPESQ